MSSTEKNIIKFGPLVTEEEMKPIFNTRSKKQVFDTIIGANKEIVEEKVKIAEKEGWIRSQENIKSYRMYRNKKSEVQLEDELWCLIYKMGYKEVSKDRNFEIQIPKDPNPRQIDVFAKDDEVALVIECTQSETPKKKSMSALIDKVNTFDEPVRQAINNNYGKEAKLKVKFIIATRNIIWGDADLEKCRRQNIIIITETEIEYFKLLTKHLRGAARFQFHGHLFRGLGIPALSKIVPATKGKMGNSTFYNFLIKPGELMKISYVSHKSSMSDIEEDIKTYQRMVSSSRLKDIAKYIEEGGMFPTNIVVNFKTHKEKPLKFERASPSSDMEFGNLTLPNQFAAAWIIDGQHRLYGYAYRDMVQGKKTDKSVLSVLAFENLPPEKETQMFQDINSKQTKVSSNLIAELSAQLHWDSPHPGSRLNALHSRIASELGKQKTSPLYNRIKGANESGNSFKCITITSITVGLEKVGLVGYVKDFSFHTGALADKNPKNLTQSLKKAVLCLSGILNIFEERVPQNWELGDAAGGYLCRNNALRAIFHVVKDICEHLEKEDKDLSVLTNEELLDAIGKYLIPLAEFFAKTNADTILAFRRLGGTGLVAVKQQSMAMNEQINNVFPKYYPKGLKEHKDLMNQEGKDEAVIKVNRINEIMQKYTIKTLKEIHGDDINKWWIEGTPNSVVQKCLKKWGDKFQEGEQYQYLDIIDYQTIAKSKENWDSFKEVFSLDSPDKSSRDERTKWIKGINDIRNKTHHPIKDPLNQKEIQDVLELYEKFLKYFPDDCLPE